MARRYAIYDVFTATRFAGNPLAVIFDGEGLSTAQMQAIAREFNLSETVFVMPPATSDHAARLRIFTPARELPFAGHPTVGAAIALAEREADGGQADIDFMRVLEEEVGPVRCAVRLVRDGKSFGEFDLPRLAERYELEISREDVAAALGIGPHEIGFENHELSLWSAGVPFLLVPVRNLDVAGKIVCDAAAWQAMAPTFGDHLASAFVYCRDGIHHEADFHARMMAPHMGIAEDPATGSAVAAFSGAVAVFDALLDGRHALKIEQGVEMGRASMIHLHLTIANGRIEQGRIGGEAVKVMEGTLLA